jgi:5-methylcytosine-specific restriction endonuclease McrA
MLKSTGTSREQLKSKKSKPCVYCDGTDHLSTFCWYKPKSRIKSKKHINKRGKVFRQWIEVRRNWFEENPSDYYTCYICGDNIPKRLTTLDHVLPRSSYPHLRFNLGNLRPCCWKCNSEKGSKKLEDLTL